MKKIFLFIVSAIALCGCQQDNWIDWKTQNDMWNISASQEEGVKTTGSGLMYRIIADPTPTDACPNSNATVVCDYDVKLINGYQIDKGKNVSLSLMGCIPGFREGCRLIHANGDIVLYIPYYLGYDSDEAQTTKDSDEKEKATGYGTEGTTGFIPPYSTLIYTIHLCSVRN